MMTPGDATASDDGGPLPVSNTSRLRAALQSWSTFNLTDRRPNLDRTAQSLLDARETSVKARKQLGELTKNLKRAVKSVETETTRENVANLAASSKGTIKRYQEEIDSLTRRRVGGGRVRRFTGKHL